MPRICASDPGVSDAGGVFARIALRVRAAAAWTAAGAAVIRAVAEVPRSRASGDDWSQGGEAEATLLNGAGKPVATGKASIDPVTFVAPITIAPGTALPADDYRLQIRVKGVSALGSTEVVSFALDAAPLGTGAMLLRRSGPARCRQPTRVSAGPIGSCWKRPPASARTSPRGYSGVPEMANHRCDTALIARMLDARAAPRRGDARAAGSRRYVIETVSGPDRTLTAFRSSVTLFVFPLSFFLL